MKPLLLFAALLGCLASVLAVDKVRWCVISNQEMNKCNALKRQDPGFDCVQQASVHACFTAIQRMEADLIVVDGGEVYTAGLDETTPLHPIIAEEYDNGTCYYAVAVAKTGTKFGLNDLRGKKSCHTGWRKSAGWNIPIGTLLSEGIMQWDGEDDSSLEAAVRDFFSSSCVPGSTAGDGLCTLCSGDCSKSHSEPYYNYNGALRCLEERGDVAFVKHLTVPVNERAGYELLCPDNTRAAVEDYKSCHLARVPGHAVVTRNNSVLEASIWTRLDIAQKNFNLFSSEGFGGKNLMVKDSAKQLLRLPSNIDAFQYLGATYTSILHSLRKVSLPTTSSKALRWCVTSSETDKCDAWRLTSGNLVCIKAESHEECLDKILHEVADVVAVDGGQVYTAAKCGLVPAMVEQYDEAKCRNSQGASRGSKYYAVALVKKDSGVTWENLQGRKSCHTGYGRNAGWNIPMAVIPKDCKLDSYFSSSCAPGAKPDSKLCSLCAGNDESLYKCAPDNNERFNGYNGAVRCLVEGVGEVAFTKHSVIFDISEGKGGNWSNDVHAEEYRLLCRGQPPLPVDQYETCNLAEVPAHAVVTRPKLRKTVVDFLKDQGLRFGSSAMTDGFSLYTTKYGKNLIFKDSTKCLQEVPPGQSAEQFLTKEYTNIMKSLRECGGQTSALEQACSFHSC